MIALNIQVGVHNLHAQSNQFAWAKRIASTTYEDSELAIGMAMDTSANLYVTGWFDGTNDFGGVTLTNKPGGGQDIFVGKYNSSGTLQWARRAGGNTAEWETGCGVGVDSAGNSYVVGYFDGTDVTFGTTTLVNAGDSNTFLVKYDSTGAFQWAKAFSSPDMTYSTSVAVDANGYVYMAGSFTTSMSIATTNFSSFGEEDGFIAKFNNAGTFQWAKQMCRCYSDWCRFCAIDKPAGHYR